MANKAYDIKRKIEGVGVETPQGKIEFAYPFFIGTHCDVFGKQIPTDARVRPAEGIEAVYLFQQAFPIGEGRESQATPGWKQVFDEYVIPSYQRIPKRACFVAERKPRTMAGVYVQRDVKGIGVSEPMNYSAFLDNAWEEIDGSGK